MATEQPDPTPNDGTPIWDLVIADMHARDALGRERYGTPLQAHNGRDALRDAYDEVLDLAAYLRQAIEERKDVEAVVAAAEALNDDPNTLLELEAALAKFQEARRD